ncbi:MAG: hypothetical protein ACI9E1_002259 [Cryomorphaceae bacterium]|jgi:hypothetical protein
MNPTGQEYQMLCMLDGELSADEAAVLNQELIANSEAREKWQSMARVHSALETRFAASKTIAQSAPIPISRVLEEQRRKVIRLSAYCAAAALVIVASLLWMITPSIPTPSIATFQTAPGSTFNLSHTSDISAPIANSLVPGSTLNIQHGVAELQFPHNVRAVVEGPASLTVLDDHTLKFDQGRGFFEITTDEGKGFTLITPQQRIVDLGTVFGIDVKAGNEVVELHVINGHVRVDALDGTKGEILYAPRSVRLDGSSIGDKIELPSFLSRLPGKLETIFEEDFESGLAAGHRYSITMDPSVVTNLAGRAFAGIPTEKPWVFDTVSSVLESIPVRNSGFEKGKVKLERGKAIPNWHPISKGGYGWSTQSQEFGIGPIEGQFFGRVFSGRWLSQEFSEPIIAGNTYVLTVDCGLDSSSAAKIRIWGSDEGQSVPLAEKTICSTKLGWTENTHLIFTATEKQATGQTLGLSLGCDSGKFAAFDRVRLGNLTARPQVMFKALDLSSTSPPDIEPQLTSLFPKRDSTTVLPSSQMRMAFDQPILMGRGLITVRDKITNTETVLIAGSPLLKIEGNLLTFLPKIDLPDGDAMMGHLSGWQSNVWCGVFNPSGSSKWYMDETLADDSRSRGASKSMNGPIMARIYGNPSGDGIYREIGKIKPPTHYTITAAIGVRAMNADESTEFSGYKMILRSGDTILAEISSKAPPGPPGSITNVGFSWNSARLPDGISSGDPLKLEIAAHAGSSGYLDVDAIRITAAQPE